MVIDVTTKPAWGGHRFALNFVEDTLVQTQALGDGAGASASSRSFVPHRPWCLVESSRKQSLFLPALSPALRQAAAQGRLIWVKSDQVDAPRLAQCALESGLCSGVLVHGLEDFARAQPAALWGRRWQLAAQKGGAHLVWIHQKPHAVIGFDVKIQWQGPSTYEIKKGYGYFHEQRFKKTLHSQSPAA